MAPRQKTRGRVALAAAAAAGAIALSQAAGGTAGDSAPHGQPVSTAATSGPSPAAGSAKRAEPARPRVVKRLIPYGPSRLNDMAAYSKRHYGEASSALRDPQLIVIHYAVAGSIGAIFNTFAPNRPDVEYGELPGVCSHYGVGGKGEVVRFVPDSIRCRHVVGLNHVSLGIEHVGFSDGDVLGNKRELKASLRLTQWLRCRHDLGIKRVIGHNESLDSRFYLELDPDFRGKTHGDFPTSAMRVYREGLRALGPC